MSASIPTTQPRPCRCGKLTLPSNVNAIIDDVTPSGEFHTASHCESGNAAEPSTETLLDRWDEQDRKQRDLEAGREDPGGAFGAGDEE